MPSLAGGFSISKDGRYVVRLQVNGKRITRYAKTEKEAKQIRLELEKQAAKTVAKPNPKQRKSKDEFSSFAESWLKVADLKPKTNQSYKQLLEKHINPIVGKKRLSEITPSDIAQVISKVKAKELSPRTVQYVFVVLRRVLQIATDWELITANPAVKVKKPKSEPKEKTAWSVEDTHKFIDSLKSNKGDWDTFFLVALMSGLRLGELLGLEWSDLDFKKDTIKVQRSLIELDKLEFHTQTPKSRSSVRTVTLPAQAIEALQQFQPTNQERKGPIFRRKDNGQPPSRSTLRSAFLAACKRAGVPYITIHGLRHQHVSLLAHAGVSVKAAQQRVGHSSPQITLSVYTHVLGEADKETAEALDNMLKRPGQG